MVMLKTSCNIGLFETRVAKEPTTFKFTHDPRRCDPP